MKKKIVLINEIGLNDVFTNAFEEQDFEVISILKKPFVYKRNLWFKILNIYYRLILKDTNFHGKNFYWQLNKEVYRRIKKIEGNVDYCLFFRADYYDEKIIKFLKEKSNLLISYQYDGWKLGKGILRHKKYLDRVYFFDKEDIAKYGEKAFPLTNCYFENNYTSTDTEMDVYYLGTHTKDRLRLIERLHARLNGNFLIKSILKTPDYIAERTENNIHFTHNSLTYNQNINLLIRAKCIIDIKFDYHDGLSFRFFEALYYNKKIITNNKSVVNYDFYNPNNIFVTDFENFDGIENFLNTPYEAIDTNVVKKYGFINWYHYVLDIPPYQEITLP